LVFAGDRARRLTLVDEALAMARRLGELSTLSHVLLARCAAIAGDPGLLNVSLDNTAEIMVMAEDLGDPFVRAWAANLRYFAAFRAGMIPEADRALDAIDRTATEVGQPISRWFAMFTRAGRLLVGGRLAEAEALARAALEIGIALGQPDAAQAFGAQRFEIRFQQGRLDEVVGRVAEVAEETNWPVTWASLALAYCELDRKDEARTVLENLGARLADVPLDFLWPLTITRAAGACAHLRDVSHASVIVELLRPFADQMAGGGMAPVWVGSVAHYLGMLATTLDRFEEADAHFTAAAATNERVGAPTWLARTRLEWARMLLVRRQTGDAERARELLRQALTTARELGLGNVERRAMALLG
jgi:tetratricopeptide (TPR) repeat protein